MLKLYSNTNLTFDFSDKVRVADASPIFKKNDQKNDRPVSAFPVVSKVFERLLHKQMRLQVEEHISPCLCDLCDYGKRFNT